MSPVQTRTTRAKDDRPSNQKGATKHDLDDETKRKSSKPKSSKVENNGKTKAVDQSTSAQPETKKKPLSSQKRDSDSTSNENTPHIVETGILNYFIRGRVEIEHPKSMDEIARGYIVMRPLLEDKNVQLTKRPLPDFSNARLLALPKKQLPHSTSDRFMAFIESANMSYSEIKNSFLAPGEYETKTAGKRHVPAATPIGEGVYAIIQTSKETHFAYLASLPKENSKLQRELGFLDRGSFIISSKNPKFPGPAYARMTTAPEYPKDIMDEFGSYRWIPSQAHHLDYKNTQLLLIGHGEKSHLTAGDEEDQKAMEEEMQDMMGDDEKGLRQLSKDESESVFADLHARTQWFKNIPESFDQT